MTPQKEAREPRKPPIKIRGTVFAHKGDLFVSNLSCQLQWSNFNIGDEVEVIVRKPRKVVTRG